MRVLQRLVRLLQIATSRVDLDVASEFSVVGQNANMIIEDLDEPAIDSEHVIATTAARAGQDGGAQLTQQRRVPGQNAHVTLFAGKLDFGDLLVDEQAFGRCDL